VSALPVEIREASVSRLPTLHGPTGTAAERGYRFRFAAIEVLERQLSTPVSLTGRDVVTVNEVSAEDDAVNGSVDRMDVARRDDPACQCCRRYGSHGVSRDQRDFPHFVAQIGEPGRLLELM
jgi:hypothetical protein